MYLTSIHNRSVQLIGSATKELLIAQFEASDACGSPMLTSFVVRTTRVVYLIVFEPLTFVLD